MWPTVHTLNVRHFPSCFVIFFVFVYDTYLLLARLLADKLFLNIYMTSAYAFQSGKELLL